MLIGGFQKCSLIDYPGRVCSIIFTLGCNFRCPYCHNPELVYPKLYPKPIPEKEILSFLARRKGKLDAVTITGGEPALQSDLADFILKVKKHGFLVKLDSNGSKPEVLENLINSKTVDYIAMDVKAPLQKYKTVTGSDIDPEKIRKSIELVMSSNTNYEFRTTVTKNELENTDILKIGELVKGARLLVLQKFVPSQKTSSDMKKYSDQEMAKFQSMVSPYVQRCIVR